MSTIADWKINLLRCNSCGSKLQIEASTFHCVGCDLRLEIDGEVLRNPQITQDQLDTDFYQDIDYSSRAAIPFTTTAREQPQYWEHIRKVIQSFNKAELVVDLGCGDGRLTQFLLSLGVERVVSIDLSMLNLKRLEQKLTENEHKKVLLLNSDILCLPLASQSFDIILAIGILNCLGDQFLSGCRVIHKLLKSGGLLVNSEPTIEGSLLYALVNHDIEEFVRVARTSTKAIDIRGDKDQRYRVFENGEVDKMLAETGLVLRDTFGISVFPSLAFGGVLQMTDYSNKPELVDVVDELAHLNIPVYRTVIYVSEKR